MKSRIRSMTRGAPVVAILAMLTACGGGDSGSATQAPPPRQAPPPPTAKYTVGGTVTGLSGPGLVLSVLYTDLRFAQPVSFLGSVTVNAAGTFTFDSVASDTTFDVGVETQPRSPTQYCSVANGSGTVSAANVTNISVTCGNGYTAGGTVSGLTGSGLVLQIDAPFYGRSQGASPPLSIGSNGPFTFDLVYPDHSSDTFVRLVSQPGAPTQLCVLNNAGINVQAANVTDIEVVCSLFSYVANAGDDTVSAYAVDATTGALAAVGTPVRTGTSPHALVGTPDRRYVFSGNERSNDISAFAVNSASGALTPVPGSPFAAGTDPKAVALYAAPGLGTYLYAANAGSDTVSAFAVDTSSGALTPLSPATFATGKGPVSLAVNGRALYVANNGGSNDVSAFSIDPATGVLTPVAGSPFPAGANPLSLTLGGAGKFLYTANPDAMAPSISGFSVDPDSGALTPLRNFPLLSAISHNITTDRAGAYLYVTAGSGVVGYGIDGTTGMLTKLPGFPAVIGTDAYSVTVDPTNQFLYVVDHGNANVAGFRLDASTGELSPIAGSPFAAGNLPVTFTTP